MFSYRSIGTIITFCIMLESGRGLMLWFKGAETVFNSRSTLKIYVSRLLLQRAPSERV